MQQSWVVGGVRVMFKHYERRREKFKHTVRAVLATFAEVVSMRLVPLLSLLACTPVTCSTSSSAAGRPVVSSFHRRQLLAASLAATTGSCLPAHATPPSALGPLVEVTDPNTYSALAYAPPSASDSSGGPRPKPPLLVVLHGAGVNEAPIRSLADPLGEHAGLAP